MSGFQIVEHTADVGVLATGSTFDEALAFLARGALSLMVEADEFQTKDAMTVELEATDAEALAVDWLNELLYLYETEGFVTVDVAVKTGNDGTSLSAVCRGERVDTENRELVTEVKAATYHGVRVTHDGQWRVRVILDV